MSKKRSVFLGDALLLNVRRLSGQQYRTVSGQICWLASVGLTGRRLAINPSNSLDDSDGRHFIYPTDDLDVRITGCATEYETSYSSAVRALVLSGLTILSSCNFCEAYNDEG